MQGSSTHQEFAGLAPLERGVLHAAGRPAIIVTAAIALIAGAGWGLLMAHWSLLGVAASGAGPAGWYAALCSALLQSGAPAAPGHWVFLAAFAMWSAMAVAMMLPAAAPMLTTYAQLAETAVARGRRLVSVLTLASGFVTAWLGFALAAAALQLLLLRAGLAGGARVEAVPWLAGLLLLAAGLYQFSAFKQACLVKCRTPFGFFMANWRESPAGVFVLGLRQGAFCIGCCWALMTAMFAAGAMNPFWMLLLAVVMIAERAGPHGQWTRRASGAALTAAGLVVLGTALGA